MTFLFFVFTITFLYFCWRLFFLRNPTRCTPLQTNIIVSPADGFVLYIKRVTQGDIPIAIKKQTKIALREITHVDDFNQLSGWLIGIYMTPISVHRNRAPIAGEVIQKTHYQHKPNLSMVIPTAEVILGLKSYTEDAYYLTNERLTTGIKTAKGNVYVTQIADKWINRIVSFVNIGDHLKMGQQYGMIRFGSQCDLFIPDTFKLEFNVAVGHYVYAGETVLATDLASI